MSKRFLNKFCQECFSMTHAVILSEAKDPDSARVARTARPFQLKYGRTEAV